MFFQLPDGQTVHIDAGFKLGENSYGPGWLRQTPPAQRAALGIVEIPTPPALEHDERYYYMPTALRPLDDCKRVRYGDLAAIRYAKETGGAVIGGSPVATDRDTQRVLTAARTLAKENAAYTVNWKAGPGAFVTLNAAQIIAIADGVAAHVQACFDREMALSTEIAAAQNLSALLAIDLNAGWPV